MRYNLSWAARRKAAVCTKGFAEGVGLGLGCGGWTEPRKARKHSEESNSTCEGVQAGMTGWIPETGRELLVVGKARLRGSMA